MLLCYDRPCYKFEVTRDVDREAPSWSAIVRECRCFGVTIRLAVTTVEVMCLVHRACGKTIRTARGALSAI